jgi:putative intracellular protease/amidase
MLSMDLKTVHVAVYDAWADWEVGHAIAHLRGESPTRTIQVKTVGATTDPVTTMGGVRIVPDMALDDLDPAGSSMLILAGASTWHEGDGNAAFGKAARAFLDAGVPVAAICGATFGLASEGLLDVREHTSGAPEYLAMAGYAGGDSYREAAAVTDGLLITAGPTEPVAFAREILAMLEVYTAEDLDAWYRLFGESDASAYPAFAAAVRR